MQLVTILGAPLMVVVEYRAVVEDVTVTSLVLHCMTVVLIMRKFAVSYISGIYSSV